MRVYLDVVFALNFAVDLLLLVGTNRLAGFCSDWKRISLASVLGGVYGAGCLLPGFRFLGNLLWRTIFLGMISVVAFGCNRSAGKRCCIFVLLSMALGGISLCMGSYDLPSLIMAGGAMLLLCRLSFGTAIGQQEYVPIRLAYGEKNMDIIALRDTGNTLRDPITGERVMVVAGDVAEKLMGLTRQQLRNPLETLALRPVPGLRLIPYSAVGQGSSLLLAVRMENVKIGSRVQSAVVAFAPEGLGSGTIYQALTGGVS